MGQFTADSIAAHRNGTTATLVTKEKFGPLRGLEGLGRWHWKLIDSLHEWECLVEELCCLRPADGDSWVSCPSLPIRIFFVSVWIGFCHTGIFCFTPNLVWWIQTQSGWHVVFCARVCSHSIVRCVAVYSPSGQRYTRQWLLNMLAASVRAILGVEVVCAVDAATTTTTTTTSTDGGGWPWWAWFLPMLGICCFLAICCGRKPRCTRHQWPIPHLRRPTQCWCNNQSWRRCRRRLAQTPWFLAHCAFCEQPLAL